MRIRSSDQVGACEGSRTQGRRAPHVASSSGELVWIRSIRRDTPKDRATSDAIDVHGSSQTTAPCFVVRRSRANAISRADPAIAVPAAQIIGRNARGAAEGEDDVSVLAGSETCRETGARIAEGGGNATGTPMCHVGSISDNGTIAAAARIATASTQ